MTRLERLQLFLRFYFSPWGAAKGAIWEDFGDREFSDKEAQQICINIIQGCDDHYPWETLEKLYA